MSQSIQDTGRPDDRVFFGDLLRAYTDLGKEFHLNVNHTPEAYADLRRKIYLNTDHTPADSSGDYKRALIYRLIEEHDDAIGSYSKAIELDPDNPGLYSSRAEAYWQMEDYEKSLQDYEKALELDNLDVIRFFEGPFDDISKTIRPVIKNIGARAIASEKELESFLKMSCERIIDRFPAIPDGYLHLGIYYLAKHDYSDAIDILSKHIRLTSNDNFGFFLRGICNSELAQKPAANDDFLEAAESETDLPSGQVSEDLSQFGEADDGRIVNNLNSIGIQLQHCTLLNITSDYSTFLAFLGKKYSIHVMIESLAIFLRPNHTKIDKDTIALAKHLDKARFEEIGASNVLSELASEVFSHYPNFTALNEAMERDSGRLFRINTKLCFLKYLAPDFVYVDLDWPLEDLADDKGMSIFGITDQRTVNLQYNFTHTFIHLTEELQRESTEINIRKEQEKAQALVDERNKIIGDLSHSIKNLISTVIDPLENLKQAKVVKPAVIRNALRGANLVREIVNAMNLSFKGSIEDFCYDARHNTDKGRMDLKSIIGESLIYAIGNMFDGKYFSNFVRNYFPTKSIFEEAKSQWTQISQSNDFQEIMGFLQKYFFEVDLDVSDGSKYVMGNEKGSAMKLLILFQELILNAVKYSAFVSKEKRFLHIKFDPDPRQISIRIVNRYKEKAKTKTSGIGHVIVENFAKLLNTEPITKKDSGIYSVEIEFENFWGK